MTPLEKRCEDCTELKTIKGVMCCYECYNQPCNEIDDCPLGLTCEDVKEAQTLTEEQKKAEKVMKNSDIHTETKKRERKPTENPEKEAIIKGFFEFLVNFGAGNVEITNKTREITFKMGEQAYKLALTATRKPKNN